MKITMKRIKDMVESAFNKKDAMEMLDRWKIFGDMTEKQYQKGRELIKKEFEQWVRGKVKIVHLFQIKN